MGRYTSFIGIAYEEMDAGLDVLLIAITAPPVTSSSFSETPSDPPAGGPMGVLLL